MKEKWANFRFEEMTLQNFLDHVYKKKIIPENRTVKILEVIGTNQKTVLVPFITSIDPDKEGNMISLIARIQIGKEVNTSIDIFGTKSISLSEEQAKVEGYKVSNFAAEKKPEYDLVQITATLEKNT